MRERCYPLGERLAGFMSAIDGRSVARWWRSVERRRSANVHVERIFFLVHGLGCIRGKEATTTPAGNQGRKFTPGGSRMGTSPLSNGVGCFVNARNMVEKWS